MVKYLDVAIKKAQQSSCRYKISALGFNKKGECIYKSFNRQRFGRKGGGVHAEMDVMSKAGPGLRYIIICRTNNQEGLLPIEPCSACKKKAQKLGVKIYSITEEL